MDTNRILIVDDDPLTCQLMAKVLKLQGFQSVFQTDVDNILAVVAEERPAVVMLDYHLGANNGLEVLQKLRNADGPVSQVPVIITSGIDREKETLEAGAQAFLLKPFDWPSLSLVIRRVAGQLGGQ